MQKYRAILLKLGDIYVETVEVLNLVVNIILVISLAGVLNLMMIYLSDQEKSTEEQWS